MQRSNLSVGLSGMCCSGIGVLHCYVTLAVHTIQGDTTCTCQLQAADQSGGAANIRASADETPEEVYNGYTEDQQTELDQMKANAQIYRDLTKSIAPQVYGHDDVKRAVLLMLFGGVHKETKEVKARCCTNNIDRIAYTWLTSRGSCCAGTSMLPLLAILPVGNPKS